MENSVAVGHVPDHFVPMSPSYQKEQKKRSNIDYENFVPSKFDEQITMLAASYSMGSISFSGYVASGKSVGGTAGNDDAEKHITMSVAF